MRVGVGAKLEGGGEKCFPFGGLRDKNRSEHPEEHIVAKNI